MKYLNKLLLNQFKKYLQKEDDNEMIENDHIEGSLQESNDDVKNEENFKEISEEILTNKDDQIPIGNEFDEDLKYISCKEEIIECDPDTTSPKTFLSHICNNEYNMYFHLKQHIKNIHEKFKSYNIRQNTIHKDQKLIEYEIVDKTISKTNNLKRHKDHICKPCGKSFTQADSLRNHIQTIHEGHKDHKCKLCGKSFFQTSNLKKHIYTIHEVHKDHKCESCITSCINAADLRRHIHTDHKDFKCESFPPSQCFFFFRNNYLKISMLPKKCL